MTSGYLLKAPRMSCATETNKKHGKLTSYEHSNVRLGDVLLL